MGKRYSIRKFKLRTSVINWGIHFLVNFPNKENDILSNLQHFLTQNYDRIEINVRFSIVLKRDNLINLLGSNKVLRFVKALILQISLMEIPSQKCQKIG